MKIALVSFLADINDQEKIDQSLADKYESLKRNFEITEIDADEVPYHDFSKYDLTLNFIKSLGNISLFPITVKVIVLIDMITFLIAEATLSVISTSADSSNGTNSTLSLKSSLSGTGNPNLLIISDIISQFLSL